MLFGDFEEDISRKEAMGEDGIMIDISKLIRRLMVLKFVITHQLRCWKALQVNVMLLWARNHTLKLELFFVANPDKYSQL
jgi:hypothetical protein